MSPKKFKPKRKSSRLSEKSLLVSTKISVWTGRKVDNRATDTVALKHKNAPDTGKYHKKLLPGSNELQKIGALSSQIREHLQAHTLPWLSDGTRILPAENFMGFSEEQRKLRQEFEGAVAEFTKAYPKLRKDAATLLGDLFDRDDYPETDEIQDKFQVDMTILPFPDSDDFRVKVSDEERAAFDAKMERVIKKATGEIWGRLAEVVKKASDCLAVPNAIFRDSLVGNLQELLDLIPSLNIAKDKDLSAVRDLLSKELKGLNADSFRKDKTLRKNTAVALSRTNKKINSKLANLL